MSYYETKTRKFLARNGYNPVLTAPLTQWATENADDANRNNGIIITATSGQIVATSKTIGDPARVQARYVFAPEHSAADQLELGTAMELLKRETGEDLIHVKAWEITRG